MQAFAAVITVAALISVTACTSAENDLTPTRVLQSVAVQVTPDASIANVRSTTIEVGASSSDTRSTTVDLDPAVVADDIPVRVRTSYRTPESSGSDLRDLAGFTGRVEIDLTVENLTVRPQDLSFDAAGQSRTQVALVGAPLTIAASTTLAGVAPDRVIVSSDSGGTTTNGVLSRSDDGDAVLQWASLLAPPSGRASSTLTLVADVDDLRVPAFDVSVQPGISTDPSLGGALEAAFNDSPTTQLALQRRTIEVVAAVNEVLGRAGTTITEVRTNLESTADTLGVRAASDLAASTTSLDASMRGLSGQLASLQTDLSSTVQGSNVAALRQMSSALTAVSDLLGDTTAPPPVAVTTGSGCAVVSAVPGDAHTVYGNIQRLGAELSTYAAAADSCKGEIQESLHRTIGPRTPDAASCQTPSATCALLGAQTEIGTALAQLVIDGRDLVDSLRPELMTRAGAQFAATSADVERVRTAATRVSDGQPDGSLDTELGDVSASLDTLATSLGSLSAGLSTVNEIAVDARAALGDVTTDGSMREQAADLADELCSLAPSSKTATPTPTPTATPSPSPTARPTATTGATVATGPTAAEVDRLRSYLTATGCKGAALTTPSGYPKPLLDRLGDDAAAWENVDEKTRSTGDLPAAVADMSAATTAARDAVRGLRSSSAIEEAELHRLVKALTDSVDALSSSRDRLDSRLRDLQAQQDELAPAIETAFAHADSETARKVSDLLTSQVRAVSVQGETDAATVGAMFDRSVAGLRATSREVVGDGATTVQSQRDGLAAADRAIADHISAQTKNALASISTSMGAATRDTEAASTLLQADLGKVLLDLGDRQVNGSGLLGSMVTSAAKVDTADVQLALAAEQSQGYANVRSEDVAGILLAQAQTSASLEAAAHLPVFHIDPPAGAATQTVYTFRIGDAG